MPDLCGNQNFTARSNHRVVLHAIDATPARRRGGVNSSPLDRARTAASSPRNDLVKNYRVHPTHWLISTQVGRPRRQSRSLRRGRHLRRRRRAQPPVLGERAAGRRREAGRVPGGVESNPPSRTPGINVISPQAPGERRLERRFGSAGRALPQRGRRRRGLALHLRGAGRGGAELPEQQRVLPCARDGLAPVGRRGARPHAR